MYVYMVCMYIHTYIHTYIRTYVPTCIHIICTYVCSYVYVYVCMCIRMYVCICIRMCTLGMQQYGSLPYCILPLSILQYIAVLQYMIKFEKRTHHVFKSCFSHVK